MTVAISDLRQRPEFFDVVADRTWREWWKDRALRLTSLLIAFVKA